MNLTELRYFAAVADHLHFGKAAEACGISQPTLSGQLRKLEEELGVTLFERSNKRVELTPVGRDLLAHARRALEEADAVEYLAKSASDPLRGRFRLGVIPTLAPYLLPKILGPLKDACPQMQLEPWEDMTGPLLEMLRTSKLDAALIATDVDGDLTAVKLFDDPFLAAVPVAHPLAQEDRVSEGDLRPDLLVLAEGHCLAMQALDACKKEARSGELQAVSLDTLVNLVGAGFGTTLIPQLARQTFEGRNIVLIPLQGHASRTVRLASRITFPRPQALRVLEKVIRKFAPAR